MEISENNLKTIMTALDTQVRLLDSRIRRTKEDELLMLRCAQIRDDIETYLLSR